MPQARCVAIPSAHASTMSPTTMQNAAYPSNHQRNRQDCSNTRLRRAMCSLKSTNSPQSIQASTDGRSKPQLISSVCRALLGPGDSMFQNKCIPTLLLSIALCGPALAMPTQDQSASQDMKDAGHETKNAAKDAGRATKKTAKKTGHAVKKTTKK